MVLRKYKKYRIIGFFIETIFPGIARRISFTFAVAVFSVVGSWFATLYAILLVTRQGRGITQSGQPLAHQRVGKNAFLI